MPKRYTIEFLPETGKRPVTVDNVGRIRLVTASPDEPDPAFDADEVADVKPASGVPPPG